MSASSLLNEYIDKFYDYLIKRGYKENTARSYSNVIRYLINKNINPLDISEVPKKLRYLRKDRRAISRYLAVCKLYKEFLEEYMEENRSSAKYKVYLTKSEASVILQVLLRIAKQYGISSECSKCGKFPKCGRQCLVENAVKLSKELLVLLKNRK